MKTFKWSYFIVFCIFYVSIFILKYIDNEIIAKYAIPLFVFITFMYSLISAKKNAGSSYLMPLALFFALCGDTLINLTSHGDLCIVAFSITHTCLILLYFSVQKFSKSDLLILLPMILLSVWLFISIQADIQTSFLRVIFAIYLSILNFMLWRAFCVLKSNINKTIKVLIVTGSILFFATDILVCMQIIYGSKIFVTFTWLLYPPALYLLSLVNIKK
jgi:hypothetical protein